MKKFLSKVYEVGRSAAIATGIGFGASQVLDSLSEISEKETKSLKKFGWIGASIAGGVALVTATILCVKKRNEAKVYEKEREADAERHVKQCEAETEQYIKQRRADAELYTLQKQADERLIQAKAAAGVFRKQKYDGRANDDDGINPENDGNEDEEQEDKTTWLEKFKSQFTMPELPPFLAKIMSGVPQGYEEAMLLHMLAMLGAMCFSKVRSVYLDGIAHAANLQVVVEGNWGTGKAKFEQLFKVLFGRILSSCKNKIDLLSDPDNRIPLIVQTTGIGTSMSKYVDILADNQGCHMYIFNSEVRALFYDLKKGNGLNFDFLRKAFENGDVCRNNKARDSKNGIFPIYLNYTLTGTPADINTSFKKELEGGTLSRIAWTCIPEAGRYPGILRLPEGNELEALKDQIDDWTEAYCYQRIPCEGDEAVGEVNVDLDYVCKALEDWNDRQFQLAEEEKNPARKDVRMRMAAIAFHCSIVIHMLYDNPAPANWQKRQKVVDLTLFIADYCIERFLHKFGKAQNLQRRANKEAEYVEDDTPQAEQKGNSSSSSGSKKITDIAELKRLHDQKDAGGQSLYGWDTLAGMSGMSPSTVRKKIKAYEASLGQS